MLEFPAAVGAGLFGTILDAWQTPLTDVGPQGEDQGKGGKYLLLSPDFKGEIPTGYIPIRSATYNGNALFRAIPASSSDEDVGKAIALVKQLKLYPLAMGSNPSEQHFIDMAGKLVDEARAGFIQALGKGEPWWPGSNWTLPEALGPKTGFSCQTADYLGLDSRGMIYFWPTRLPQSSGPQRSTLWASMTPRGINLKAEALIICTFHQMCLHSNSGR